MCVFSRQVQYVFYFSFSHVQIFDFTNDDQIELAIWTNNFTGYIMFASDPPSLVEEITNLTGRMRADLPSWVDKGLILGTEVWKIHLTLGWENLAKNNSLNIFVSFYSTVNP